MTRPKRGAAPRQEPVCSSGKRAYLDKAHARTAIGNLRRWQGLEGPLRPYRCVECRAYHLTSQARRIASLVMLERLRRS